MITVSSNLATNLFVEKLGVDNIRATVHALHADGMSVLRGVEDNKAFEKGMNNTTTARGLLILLEVIATGRAVDADSSRRMVEILAHQKPFRLASLPVRAWRIRLESSPRSITTRQLATRRVRSSW
jgi:hypothetical protein